MGGVPGGKSTADVGAAPLLAVGFLIAGLMLFFTATVPALRERHALQQAEKGLGNTLQEYHKLLRDFGSRAVGGRGERAGHYDLQALLVAIDNLGHTPAEILTLFPEER